jgi:small GTP-binding protein
LGGPQVFYSHSSPSSSRSYLYKVLILGDAGVGKSSLIKNLTNLAFDPSSKATIGVEFSTKLLTLDSGKRVKLQLWDTAGQERYRSITASFFRGAAGAIVVYDVTFRKR